ncbi:hypothetical protein FEF31_03675 [Mesomycoplasma hyopneumoniae]|uniref:Uncharacterized protein n=2 Tax=Mesomycoplasma hyopneumoniae TaxID=2099 RepID=A4Q7Y8_MESH7|nr:hypothetical protein MHP7448_0721 [Mesomycoplasma hyopneumoniae 7448]MCI8283602.1 hypothetical protein [Mesomycoplasma hyopneumoniae]MCI8298524.1 hypothetical protein [Mesomycoplasma hyopneumoniae]MCI8298692.1 hypothetical protein [Mesomycoplasma hyopneumoniae]
MLSFTANYSQILTNFEFYLKLFNAVNLKMLLYYNSFLNLKKEKKRKIQCFRYSVSLFISQIFKNCNIKKFFRFFYYFLFYAW